MAVHYRRRYFAIIDAVDTINPENLEAFHLFEMRRQEVEDEFGDG